MDIGGAERLLTEIVPMINTLGHTCDVALFDGHPTSFKTLLLKKGVKILDFSQGRSVYHPYNIFSLLKLIKHYDIVHTHNMSPQLFGAITSVFRNVRLITTEHSTSNRRRNWWWYKLVDSWMYSRYKAIISISPSTTENLCQYLKISCPIYTIYNGVNVKKYSESSSISRDELQIKKDSILLVMVAGFRQQKDQKTVVRALSKLPPRYELVFVGDGPYKKECISLAKELSVYDRVHFLGIRSDVANILKASDIVIMSSHWEGFGLAAVEGMAAGKPVIASDVPGLSEVVKGAGLLFPRGDDDKLSSLISSLILDKTRYKEIASKCLNRSYEYDINKMVEKYIDVYKKITK